MDTAIRFATPRRASLLGRRCSFARRVVAGLTSLAVAALTLTGLSTLPSVAAAEDQQGTTIFLGKYFEKRPDGTTINYIYAGDLLVAAVIKPPTGPQRIQYVHQDHLGSTSVVTDETGRVVEQVTYKPFGEVHRREIRDPNTGQLITADLSPSVTPFGFTGQRLDSSTGLHYYGSRYYDAQLGRFLQPDPFVQYAGDPQLLNRYSYARNNPVNFVDPSGNFIEWVFLAIAAVFAASVATSAVSTAVSFLASATGHEHTAQRTARVAVASGQIAFGIASVANLLTLGEATGAVFLTGALLSAAYTAQGVARDIGEEQLPLGGAFSRQFLNTGLTQTPMVGQLYGAYLGVVGANPLTGETFSPIERALVGGLALVGLRGPTAHRFANQLVKSTRRSAGRLLKAYRVFGAGEAEVVRKTGHIPNVDQFGRPKEVFLSTGRHTSVTEAERALQVGRLDPRGPRPSPKFGAEADLRGVKLERANLIDGGTDIEVVTYGAPRVREIFELDAK